MFVNLIFSVPLISLQSNYACWCTRTNKQIKCKQNWQVLKIMLWFRSIAIPGNNNNNVHYHAFINALSSYTIHINQNMILSIHVEHSPTKTIYIKHTHTHTHTHTQSDCSRNWVLILGWKYCEKRKVFSLALKDDGGWAVGLCFLCKVVWLNEKSRRCVVFYTWNE